MKYKADSAERAQNVGAVIVCAGKGERTGLAYNKILHKVGQKTVIENVLDTFFCICDSVNLTQITLVVSQNDIDAVSDIISTYADNRISITPGGATRGESVYNGLKACPCDVVIIHDGARPYVTPEILKRSVSSAIEHGSGIAAVHSVDTVKRVQNGKLFSLPRTELFNAQTPQTFNYARILDAYGRVEYGACTDDAEVYEKAGYSPVLIDGDYSNTKITTAHDLFPYVPKNCKIGIGYDVHRLVSGRNLILGGVKIDYPLGLLGHSDADVLIHAIMDALLSAAGLPDIGVLFPDTDDRYLGASSIDLLKNVIDKIYEMGFAVGNISAVIIAQRPKLATVIPQMRRTVADIISTDISRINISATTTEGLGIVGSGDAIAANACCLLTEHTNER